MDSGQLTDITIAYHRNGTSGEGFYVATFTWHDPDIHHTRRMVGTLFAEPGQCAVYDIDELAKGNIVFGQGNSWRGDHFEGNLREAIAHAEGASTQTEEGDTSAQVPQVLGALQTEIQRLRKELDKVYGLYF